MNNRIEFYEEEGVHEEEETGGYKYSNNPKQKWKQMNIEEILEAQEPNAENMTTILSIMMLIWFEGILLVLPDIMKKVTLMALKKRKISCKRILEQMSSALSCIKENLQIRKIELSTCSIQDFVDILRETVYYTIYTKHSIQQEDSEWILNCLIEALPDQCSSSLVTETTSIQSMIARTATIPADVNSPSTSKTSRMALEEDTIDELFRPSNIASNIGTIQQSIAKRDGDIVVTLKSPGECGYRVIKLDIYEFGKIQHVPKNQWWQQATYRSTFITSSLADPKEVLVRRLLNMAANRFKENSKSGKGGKGDEIIIFLKRRPTSPLSQIFSSSAWLKSKYKFYDLNSIMMRNCIRIVNNMYNEMSTKQIYLHFQSCEPQHMFFNAPQGNISGYYYDIEKSVKVLENLLYFQFNNNQKDVCKFLENLYNVVDKLLPKKNSIFILSPPNAGKNFFFDCVIHFYINFGQMGNFNRYCNFPMMECFDRRIILWNEPMMEPAASETLKMILGGDTVNAKVKYQNDAVITRTPVIILSNNDIFPKDDPLPH